MAFYINLFVSSHSLTKWYCREKKIGTFETACTLLLGANVFVHHGGNVILIACFLITRMSSSPLNIKVPYSISYPNDTLFHVPLVCLVVYVLFMIG